MSKSKFKVGDRVKILENATETAGNYRGLIGVIKNFSYDSLLARVKIGEDCFYVNADLSNNCEIEKVEEFDIINCLKNIDYCYYKLFFENHSNKEISVSDLLGCVANVSNETPTEKLIENKMDFEKIKEFDKKNLVEGKKKSEEEKATYEATEAKKFYTDLINRKEEQQRKVKIANEEIKQLDEQLKVFNKK
jgi:hypothetical protein